MPATALKKKRCAILQSNYIPWKGYFDLINSVDEFVIYDNVQYTKNDWRNRNLIKTAQGVQWITIPVNMKGRINRKIEEIEIADPAWGKKHWTTIKQNYSKAKHFNEFKDLFEAFYLTNRLERLTDINQELIRIVAEILGIRTSIRNVSEFAVSGERCSRLVDICKTVAANTYISGPAAKCYMDLDLFQAADIEVVWMDYSGYPEYSQLHPPFAHGVSVLDLVFNEGKNATAFMKSFSQQKTEAPVS